jgi:hypothetical protein
MLTAFCCLSGMGGAATSKGQQPAIAKNVITRKPKPVIISPSA